jgi:hypothetical protein
MPRKRGDKGRNAADDKFELLEYNFTVPDRRISFSAQSVRDGSIGTVYVGIYNQSPELLPGDDDQFMPQSISHAVPQSSWAERDQKLEIKMKIWSDIIFLQMHVAN